MPLFNLFYLGVLLLALVIVILLKKHYTPRALFTTLGYIAVAIFLVVFFRLDVGVVDNVECSTQVVE